MARGRLGRYLQYPHLHPAPLGEAGLIVGVCDDFVFALDPKGPRLRKLASDPSLLGTTGFLVDVEGTLHYASRTRWRTCRLQAVWPAKAGLPVRHSQNTKPSANTSVRASARSPRACSGDM